MAAAARDAIPAGERLRITEIFLSLQGEADTAGIPTVFVRLTGCPLRCRSLSVGAGTPYAATPAEPRPLLRGVPDRNLPAGVNQRGALDVSRCRGSQAVLEAWWGANA